MICLKCLQKDIAKRYKPAQEVVDELQQFERREPILDRPIGRVESAWTWCRRRPWIAGLSAATVVSLLVGTIVSLYSAWEANQRAHEADVNAGMIKNARNEAQKRATDAERSALEALRGV